MALFTTTEKKQIFVCFAMKTVWSVQDHTIQLVKSINFKYKWVNETVCDDNCP